jgi:8-oxo-dGTP pyrophosphatase MutT (NUDIX family)
MSTPHRLFVSVKAAIWRGGALLLTEEIEPGTGQAVFDLPGGRVDTGEDLEAGLRREVREELGVELAEVGLLPVRTWTVVNPEGVGVVGLLYEASLVSDAFDHSAAPEGIVGFTWARPGWEGPLGRVHGAVIQELLSRR